MSKLRNSTDSYGWLAKAFHWIIALLIIGILVIGNIMGDFKGPTRLEIYGLHKSVGILILFLVFLRYSWRQANTKPKLPTGYPLWMKISSEVTHYMIYILMFAMPLSGWAMSSAAGFPVSFFGLFTMPHLIAADKENLKLLREFHDTASWILIGLLCMHVGAALFHHIILKDNILRRMLPALLLVSMPAYAADLPEYKIDNAASKIEFTAIQNDAPVTAQFKSFSGKVQFNPEKLAQSKVVAQVDMKTVSADYDEVASSLVGDEWFDVTKFPTASFESDSFTKVSEKEFICIGKLKIRDAEKPAQIKFTLDKFTPEEAEITGEMTINRNDFGVGQGEWKNSDAVKEEVTVKLKITAKR